MQPDIYYAILWLQKLVKWQSMDFIVKRRYRLMYTNIFKCLILVYIMDMSCIKSQQAPTN